VLDTAAAIASTSRERLSRERLCKSVGGREGEVRCQDDGPVDLFTKTASLAPGWVANIATRD
jgi:hypothetical protein